LMRARLALLLLVCAMPLSCGKSGGKDDDLRITSDDRRPAKPHDPEDEPEPAKPKLTGPVIVLDDKQLTIDGVKLGLLPHVPDFVALFGKAERTDPTGNVIHIYEKRGLLLYETPDAGRVIELTVIFGEQPGFPFTPKKMFAGTLVVQGMRIDATTTLESVKTKLPMFKWETGLGNDVDTYISKHQTFFIAPEGKNEVAEVAISFPQEPSPPP
ncbi:MAG: hypothetical protein ABI175_13385, partial [Polyangiales bacterium]